MPEADRWWCHASRCFADYPLERNTPNTTLIPAEAVEKIKSEEREAVSMIISDYLLDYRRGENSRIIGNLLRDIILSIRALGQHPEE